MKYSLLMFLPIMALLVYVEAHAATIQLPSSGQTKCYDPTVNTTDEIPCAETGQDGDKLMGVFWNDATRFTASKGTVTDNLTGLIWLQKANCTETVGGIAKANGLTWANALTWSNNLASGKCGLTDGSSAGQWRLPTLNELESLINRGQSNSSIWLATKNFSDVKNSMYWTSSSYAVDTSFAWYVSMVDGHNSNFNKTNSLYVWPVRGGQ